jgi:hypothetical protein
MSYVIPRRNITRTDSRPHARILVRKVVEENEGTWWLVFVDDGRMGEYKTEKGKDKAVARWLGKIERGEI